MKVLDLINVLKKLPQESQVSFKHGDSILSFDYTQVEINTFFQEFDDDGIRLKKTIVKTNDPETYINLV